jgi:hypothetical protein
MDDRACIKKTHQTFVVAIRGTCQPCCRMGLYLLQPGDAEGSTLSKPAAFLVRAGPPCFVWMQALLSRDPLRQFSPTLVSESPSYARSAVIRIRQQTRSCKYLPHIQRPRCWATGKTLARLADDKSSSHKSTSNSPRMSP